MPDLTNNAAIKHILVFNGLSKQSDKTNFHKLLLLNRRIDVLQTGLQMAPFPQIQIFPQTRQRHRLHKTFVIIFLSGFIISVQGTVNKINMGCR